MNNISALPIYESSIYDDYRLYIASYKFKKTTSKIKSKYIRKHLDADGLSWFLMNLSKHINKQNQKVGIL